MNIQGVWETILLIPASVQTGIVMVFGVLILITIKMTKNRGFKKQILQSKKVKEEVVKYLLNNLETTYYLTNKALRDNEVVEMYNTETLVLALRATDKLERIEGRLDMLEEKEVEMQLSSYIQDVKTILTGIYHMENHLYDNKKLSEQITLSYNRRLNDLNPEDNNTDKAAEIKTAFRKEVGAHKQQVIELERMYQKHREHYREELHKLNSRNEYLQILLDDYKRKHVDSKRFYASRLVYA